MTIDVAKKDYNNLASFQERKRFFVTQELHAIDRALAAIKFLIDTVEGERYDHRRTIQQMNRRHQDDATTIQRLQKELQSVKEEIHSLQEEIHSLKDTDAQFSEDGEINEFHIILNAF